MKEKVDKKNIDNQVNEKEENKGRALFYSIIAVAIIILLVVGATYAFFTSNIASGEGDISVGSSVTLIRYSRELDTFSPRDIIPTADNIAKYAFENQTTVTYSCNKTENDVTTKQTVSEDDYILATTSTRSEDKDETIDYTSCKRIQNSRCVDDNANPVCGYYHFSVTNSDETMQEIGSINIKVVTNTFENLYFVLYAVENGELVQITETNYMPFVSNTVLSTDPNTALGESQIALATGASVDNLIHQNFNDNKKAEYYIVTWLHETGSIQNEIDGNKAFSGTIEINMLGGEKLTGTISAVAP